MILCTFFSGYRVPPTPTPKRKTKKPEQHKKRKKEIESTRHDQNQLIIVRPSGDVKRQEVAAGSNPCRIYRKKPELSGLIDFLTAEAIRSSINAEMLAWANGDVESERREKLNSSLMPLGISYVLIQCTKQASKSSLRNRQACNSYYTLACILLLRSPVVW